MNDLISLIVPVYNGEQYLPRFLEQYKAQTYKNIELLLIDDGSTDKTASICEKFGEENKSVSVYRKKTEGLLRPETMVYRKQRENILYLLMWTIIFTQLMLNICII